MSQEALKLPATVTLNKKEKKADIMLVILFLIISLLAMLVTIVSKLQAAAIAKEPGYIVGLPNFQVQYDQYNNYFMVGLIITIVWLAVTTLAIISVVKKKAIKLSVLESGIKGVAVKRRGICLKTTHVGLSYADILSVERLPKKKLQDRYLYVTAKDGKKFIFAVENCQEMERLISAKIGV